MLRKYIPADRYPKEKLISTVNTMSDHINRLENYVSAMNTLYRLEDITVEPRPVEGEKSSPKRSAPRPKSCAAKRICAFSFAPVSTAFCRRTPRSSCRCLRI